MEDARLKNQKLMAVYQEYLKKRASSLLPQDCIRLVSCFTVMCSFLVAIIELGHVEED